MKNYRFTKTGQDWYIDLPEFIEQGGSIGDLQMVDGADKMLDMIAGLDSQVTLCISSKRFADSDILTLTEKCDAYIGGAYYFLKQYNGQEINQTMWLCHVTEFVFGELPLEIFIKRIQD